MYINKDVLSLVNEVIIFACKSPAPAQPSVNEECYSICNAKRYVSNVA